MPTRPCLPLPPICHCHCLPSTPAANVNLAVPCHHPPLSTPATNTNAAATSVLHPPPLLPTADMVLSCVGQYSTLVSSPSPGGEKICIQGRVGVFTLQLYDNTTQSQNMLLLPSPWHNDLAMTSRFWQPFRPTYANRHASADRARPTLSGDCGNWHGLAEMAAKRHRHKQM